MITSARTELWAARLRRRGYSQKRELKGYRGLKTLQERGGAPCRTRAGAGEPKASPQLSDWTAGPATSRMSFLRDR